VLFSRGRRETFTLLLSPEPGSDLFVRFEPIGPEYTLTGDDHLKIEATSPAGDPVQIVCGPGYITIWPAPQARVRASNATGDELEFLM